MYIQTLPSNVDVIAYTHVYSIYAKSKNQNVTTNVAFLEVPNVR